MLDHVGLRVHDLAASTRFFGAALAPLGYTLQYESAEVAGFGPPGEPRLWLHAVHEGPPGGAHLAFSAPSRAAVHAFHAAGLAAGGRDHGAPGPRPDYAPHYYAAFLVDGDGNNVEAVCLQPPA